MQVEILLKLTFFSFLGSEYQTANTGIPDNCGILGSIFIAKNTFSHASYL